MALKPLQDKPYTPGEKPDTVDSKKEVLDVGRIVVIASYHTESKSPPNQVAMSILMELQQPETIVEQIGNTLFIAHKSEQNPNNYVFRGINADTAQNYMENAKQFIYKMKAQGVKQLATQFTGNKILQMIKASAKQMQTNPNTPVDFRLYKRGDDYLVNIILSED